MAHLLLFTVSSLYDRRERTNERRAGTDAAPSWEIMSTMLNCDDKTIQPHTKYTRRSIFGATKNCCWSEDVPGFGEALCCLLVGVIISPTVPLNRTLTSRLGTLPRKLRSYRGEVCQKETHCLLLQPMWRHEPLLGVPPFWLSVHCLGNLLEIGGKYH